MSWARRNDVTRALPGSAARGSRRRRRAGSWPPRRAGPRARCSWEQPDEGPDRRPRLTQATREQPDDELDEREEDDFQRAQREAGAAGQGGEGAQAMTGPQQVVVEIGTADLELLAVAGPRRGATTTRAPLRWTRQHRSTSSPW